MFVSKFIDLSGQKFGYLTVVERDVEHRRPNGKTRTYWRCKCDCGNDVTVAADALRRGDQVSCGCYRRQSASQQFATHGKTKNRLYTVWAGIKARCYNPNTRVYPYYGGRGIQMCDEWKNDFSSFYDWMTANGYDENAKRGEFTIDRIDPNGNYSPENCRLVTQLEQMNNVRSNHIITYNDESHTIAEWSRMTGINQFKIRNRIVNLGWSVERALTTA